MTESLPNELKIVLFFNTYDPVKGYDGQEAVKVDVYKDGEKVGNLLPRAETNLLAAAQLEREYTDLGVVVKVRKALMPNVPAPEEQLIEADVTGDCEEDEDYLPSDEPSTSGLEDSEE